MNPIESINVPDDYTERRDAYLREREFLEGLMNTRCSVLLVVYGIVLTAVASAPTKSIALFIACSGLAACGLLSLATYRSYTVVAPIIAILKRDHGLPLYWASNIADKGWLSRASSHIVGVYVPILCVLTLTIASIYVFASAYPSFDAKADTQITSSSKVQLANAPVQSLALNPPPIATVSPSAPTPPSIHYSQLFNWIALGLVAIISMIVGPCIQWKIAKRQTEFQAAIAKRQVADSIAGRRQAWIDALRSEIAEFLTVAESVVDLDRHRHSLEVDAAGRRVIVERQTEHMVRGIFLKASIALRLNINELDHVLLGDALDALSQELNKCDIGQEIDGEDCRRLHQPVLDRARVLLKKEWTRVKSGDL